jgi:hypothetical protein
MRFCCFLKKVCRQEVGKMLEHGDMETREPGDNETKEIKGIVLISVLHPCCFLLLQKKNSSETSNQIQTGNL